MTTTTTLLALAASAISSPGWAITAHQAARLRRRLRTDRLTRLANRDGLAHAFDRACRRADTVGVLLLDLDKFKQINDSHGHTAGNTVLQHVAKQMSTATRSGELATRLHGDEFAVLLGRLPAGAAGLRVADERAAAIAEALARPVAIDADGTEITPSASVGAAVCTAGHAELSALLRAADQRMYAAKHRTRPTRPTPAEPAAEAAETTTGGIR